MAAPATDPEPDCPHCRSSMKPELLTPGVYLCNCCARIFEWPAARIVAGKR